MKQSSGAESEGKDVNGTSYWIHKLREDPDDQQRRPPPPPDKVKSNAEAYFTAEEAIAACKRYTERDGVRFTSQWTYRNAQGVAVLHVLRFDSPSGKIVKPVSCDGHTWHLRHPQTTRVLYDLPDLELADMVIVTEGEKAAEAAKSIGLVATTSSGGSGAGHVEKHDWSPLAGKSVVILPDNDPPGDRYADSVTAELFKLSPHPSIKRVVLPVLPHKGDIADWLEARDSVEAEDLRRTVMELVEAAVLIEPPKDTRFRIRTIKIQELFEKEFHIEYLVEHVLAAGYHGLIAGRFKALKTSVMMDLAVSIATGTMFLTEFWVPQAHHAGVICGEGGLIDLQDKLRRIAGSKDLGWQQLDKLHLSQDLPRLSNPEHVLELQSWIVSHQLRVCFIDPTYLAMSGIMESASNLIMGKFLESVSQVGEATNCTMMLCHHLNRTASRQYEVPQIGDIVHAGFPEWSGQTILLSPRREWDPDTGEHTLWFKVESRAGHAFCKGLDVREGTLADGRVWEPLGTQSQSEILQGQEQDHIEREAERRQRQAADDERKLRRIMVEHFPKGGTKTAIKELARGEGVSAARFEAAMVAITADGRVEPCQVAGGNGQTYPGLRPTEHCQFSGTMDDLSELPKGATTWD